MEVNNYKEVNSNQVNADIRFAANKKKIILILAIFYVVYLIFFFVGFSKGCHEYHSEGGTVINRDSEWYGYSFPESDSKYIGWYSLIFSYEGEGWTHNYLYDFGYSNNKTVWNDINETYPENVVICVIINLALVALPFVTLIALKAGSKKTVIELRDEKIYGSSAEGFIKKKVDIPYSSINDIIITKNFLDKLRTGSTMKVIHSTKSTSFHYIHNPEELKNVILESVKSRPFVSKPAQSVVATPSTSDADELKKFKDLLDSGVITEEEYEAKKKQILGL